MTIKDNINNMHNFECTQSSAAHLNSQRNFVHLQPILPCIPNSNRIVPASRNQKKWKLWVPQETTNRSLVTLQCVDTGILIIQTPHVISFTTYQLCNSSAWYTIEYPLTIFSQHTHKPFGKWVYQEDTGDKCEIPWYTTRGHYILTIFYHAV